MDGANAKMVRWEQITDVEWFSVLRESKDRSRYRIKCSCIHSDMYDQVMQLHYKVYQKPPTNMEINSAFAKGFVKEFSPVAIASGSAMQFNWADFAVQHLQDLREKGYYEAHVQKWRARNLCQNIEEGSAEMKEDYLGRVATNISKATKATLLSHHSTHQGIDSLSYFGLENLQHIKVAGDHLRKQLQNAKQHLVTAKQEFKAARVSQASNARVSLIVLAMRQKLRDADNELQSLLQSHSVDVKREIDLKVKIETLKETLDGLRFSHSEDTPLDLEFDITCQRINVEVMEEKANSCERQLQLLMHISKMLQGSFFPTALCNLAMDTFTESIGGVCDGTMINPCTGCGLPLEVKEINATVKMPCGHSYHLLCFAAALLPVHRM